MARPMSVSAIASIVQATTMPSYPCFTAEPPRHGSDGDRQTPPWGRQTHHTEREDLVGVFGGKRGIVGCPRLPTHNGPHTTLSRPGRRQPFLAFERWLENHEPRVACLGGHHDRLGHATNTDLCGLGRIRGLEHKGARHRGKRQVERHVDDDHQDEQPPMRHVADSNPGAALKERQTSGAWPPSATRKQRSGPWTFGSATQWTAVTPHNIVDFHCSSKGNRLP